MSAKPAKAKRVGMEVSIAVSHAVQLARAEAIAAYPITPQTHIVEHLSSLVANGELEAEFVNVESEHSAISTCIGMSASGARTYTATSSQGLALMHEILYTRRPSIIRSWPSRLPKTIKCYCPPSSTWMASSSPTWWRL
ncbi:MAG: hypothetical protein P8X58_14080 [Syntrophobacterales bacterium]